MTRKKSEVKPKAESTKLKAREHSVPDSYRDNIPRSEMNKSEIEHSTFENKEMEVHHHPDLHHKPKPWKEYVLEYLMIFLAVMTGFFAESYREHLGDKEKERQYMHAMVADLQKDSVQINNEIAYANDAIVHLDSLFKCLHSPKLTDSVEEKLYELNMKAGPLVGFEFSDAASTQLKNTGGLRLIQKEEVTNAIVHYWAKRENVKLDMQVFNQNIQAFWEDDLNIFDKNYLRSLTHSDEKDTGFKIEPNAHLLTHDKSKLTEYANRVGSLLISLRMHYVKSLLKQKAVEADLESLINKNYKF